MQEFPRLATHCAQLHALVVQRQYGHWHHLDPAAQSALQWRLAPIHLIHPLRAECSALRHLPHTVDLEIHAISKNLVGDGTAPGTESLSWNIPDGSGNDHQHDDFCLCQVLGRKLVESHLGNLVVRRSRQCGLLFCTAIHHVSPRQSALDICCSR